jgi:hypothetical protein
MAAPPVITAPPTNLTVLPGGTATFTVTCTGTEPFVYEWRFNNTTLTGQISATLIITNVSPLDAGNYVVVVSNVSGAATSAPPALLRVLVPPTGGTPGLSAGQFSLSVDTIAGLTYTLEYKNNLNEANWTSVTPSVTGDGTRQVLRDTAATGPMRFYRLKVE